VSIQIDTKVGEIATRYPMAIRILSRHGIDFCCGGGNPLEEICEQSGLDARAVLAEIESEIASHPSEEVNWGEAPLDDLIEHILVAYHKPLKEELPRLEAMIRKVLDVHGDKRPEMLPELLVVYTGLKAELEQHMAKEEEILFPMIRRGRGAMALGPIAVMEEEHVSAGQALRRLRKLTGDYDISEEACNTWRALWHGLAALEDSLLQHIHLENNILFPRAVSA
jgi:regulator of cell morphogenesis and NO signaling